MQSTNAPFATWVATQNSVILPITLISFKITETTEAYVQLDWTTVFEENFEKFVVERSFTGKTFEAIGEVQGTGYSKTIVNYSYSDNSPGMGKNYYRLKSIDVDGTFEYSSIIVAELSSSKKFSTYPNPSNGEFVNLKMNFESQTDDIISILDYHGSEVMQKNMGDIDGRLEFDTPLEPGVYFIKYTSQGFSQIERLVVK
jgi:Secretion system C-terminal sorting domain